MPIIAAAVLLAAAGQTTIDSHGIRAGGVTIDGAGVHTPGGSVDSAGVHRVSAGRGLTILTNRGHRSVDCRGGGLTVNGNGNTLDVVNCARVVVAGNGNTMTVRYSLAGRLSVVGNRNDVSWRASKGVTVRASNVGTRNAVRRTAWS